MINREKSAEPKKNLTATIHKFIKKVFGFLKSLLHLLHVIIEDAMRLTIFAFTLLVRLVANPTAPIIVSIFLFLFVSAIAARQWFLMGVWLGHLTGASGMWGITAGTFGLLLGLGINIFQIGSELWKLSRSIARAYLHLGIDVESNEKGTNPAIRNEMFLTLGHGDLKGMRLVSYGIETALVLAYAYFTGLDFFTLVTAGISLVLPEQVLKLVSSTTAVLGKVSDVQGKEEPTPEEPASFY